jgi:SHO1 osmosensor
VFGSVALVFSVFGVNQGIFTNVPAMEAMAAGWLLLAIVNVLWVLYFTSEENSLSLHIFNTFGTGGLTGPGRNGFRPGGRRMTGSHVNMQNGGGMGYTSGMGGPDYGSPSMMGGGMGIGGGYDTKEPAIGGMDRGQLDTSQRSLGGGGSINSVEPGSRGGRPDAGSRVPVEPMSSPSAMAQPLPSSGGDMQNPSTPLMTSGNPGSSGDAASIPDTYLYRAKALYACE